MWKKELDPDFVYYQLILYPAFWNAKLNPILKTGIDISRKKSMQKIHLNSNTGLKRLCQRIMVPNSNRPDPRSLTPPLVSANVG
jgi:hypothetical protein